MLSLLQEKPKRRWFQFSLWTMFVLVTLASISLACSGYHLNWISQRHAMRENFSEAVCAPLGYSMRKVTAPGGLWLFGEIGVSELYFDEKHANRYGLRVEDIKQMFPESQISWVGLPN